VAWGGIGLQHGDNALAVEKLSQAITANGNLANAYELRGLAYKALGDKAKAGKDLQQYLDMLPTADDKAEVDSAIAEMQK
jgi:regulator of sirC expression with transglutaminase-like and TPR domain